MFSTKPPLLLLSAVTAAVLLHPTGMKPVRNSPAQLPTDSLARAIALHKPSLFELCLAQRVDVNGADAEGRTPLLIATAQQDRAIVERLLALGADVDLPDRSGRTPLMTAAALGDLDLLRIFEARSRCPEAADNDGRAAAHHALLGRHYDAFAILMPHLVAADLTGAAGDELLTLAFESGDVRVITRTAELLSGGLDWTPQTRGALKVALETNDSYLLKLLLRKHATGPTVAGTEIPMLAQAIVDGDASTFRSLLAAGVDPNAVLPKPIDKGFSAGLPEHLRGYVRADEGITPLMLAAGLEKGEYIRALLEAGAERSRITKRYKMLALYFAARTRKAECVQILLGRGPTREELRVEISLGTQRASILKDGIAILDTPVSTGRKGYDTPAGEYVITDKKRSHISSLYHVQMPYFMRLNCLDFGLHAGNVPNYPASHGCIRLPSAMAEKLFSELPVGTVVTIN